MHAEPAVADTQELKIPPELASALARRSNKPETDYVIESLKPSLLGRLIEKLIGPKN